MRRPAAAQHGFTLLEIMIAMTLSVVLLGVLTAGMRVVVDEWQSGNSRFESEIDTSLVLLQLEQALLGASPHSYTDRDTLERNVYFVGGTDSLTWVSSVSPQARQGRAAWQLAGGGRDGVVLKSTPAFADDPTARLENATGTLILPDFDLNVSYLTLDDLARPEWLEEWDGAEYQSLPMAVRLELASMDRSSDLEMEIIVPLLNAQHEEIQPVEPE